MAAMVAIVVEQVNDAKSVQNPAFAPPLHPFFTVHRLQPAAWLLLKTSCTNCTCAEAISISAPPGFKKMRNSMCAEKPVPHDRVSAQIISLYSGYASQRSLRFPLS